MSYIIAPLQLAKTSYTEFRDVMAALDNNAIARAGVIWPGFQPAGLLPGNQQYGHANLLPKRVLGTGTFTWVQRFTFPGSWGNIYSYTVPNDELHAYAGIIIPDPLAFSQLQVIVSDRTYPIIEIEEARGFYQGVAIIVKADAGQEWLVEEKKNFTLKGYQERGTGGITQRIIPIGFALYRNKDVYINLGAHV